MVFKENSSSIDGTDLHQVLSDLEIDRLIICGGFSEFCVASSVKDALALGFHVCLAADGHSTVSDDEANGRAITTEQNKLLAELGARVVDIAAMPDVLS